MRTIKYKQRSEVKLENGSDMWSRDYGVDSLLYNVLTYHEGTIAPRSEKHLSKGGTMTRVI